jgi:hypothetical protein
MFFSGNLLPLATESSIELHMSFFWSSFLSSGPVPVEALVYVENRFEFAVMIDDCQKISLSGSKIAYEDKTERDGTWMS